jgi:signal transduction histidine kinase
MAERREHIGFGANDGDAARDLRNALLVGALTVLVFGTMVLATESGTGVLQVPTPETALLAASAAVITLAGLLALRVRLPVRPVAWVALTAYTVIISLTVHFTGGPLTPMPALYLLVVVAASFLLGRRGATSIAVLSVAGYALMLALEYSGMLSMVLIWRQEFDPAERGMLLALHWLAVAVPVLFTAQLGGTLAERLRRSNVYLRESERLRENQTQMLVHDLRNPATALMGGVEVLRLTMKEQMDAEQRQLLENARRSGHVLLSMLEEMLDITRVEAGRLQLDLEPVDLAQLLAESCESVRVLADVDGLGVRAYLNRDLGTVWCDRQLIERVVANLLSNALKYTPSGGSITLSARREGDEFVTVSVSDTGSGIPPQHHQRIFEKFGTLEQPGRGRAGIGLGLVFCRMAVEAHGGRIWVESDGVEGCTFTFTLPTGEPPAE